MAKTINLTQGHVAIVDDEDFDLLNRFKWHFASGYAKRRVFPGDGSSHLVRMHRVILNAPDGVDVDHKNGNGLDNRRENLRLATDQQNLRNQRIQTKPSKKSRYKGVSENRYRYKNKYAPVPEARNPWRAYIVNANRQYGLGNYATEEEAARAYDAKAKELFGEFANLNFPNE